MKQFYITEDTRAAKLYVTFSHTLSNMIDTIEAYNQNKHDGIIQLANYLEGLKEYLSNPQIAFDYAHKYQHFRNGAIHLEELGYNVSFIVKTNKYGQSYVYVFKINLDVSDFGLDNPYKTETKQYSKLDTIITEVLNRYLGRELLRA